jgi:hypothetical protein
MRTDICVRAECSQARGATLAAELELARGVSQGTLVCLSVLFIRAVSESESFSLRHGLSTLGLVWA